MGCVLPIGHRFRPVIFSGLGRSHAAPTRNADDSAAHAFVAAKAGVCALLRKTEMTARIAYPKVSFSFRTMGCKSYRELKAVGQIAQASEHGELAHVGGI
jgi:hypothetical protein